MTYFLRENVILVPYRQSEMGCGVRHVGNFQSEKGRHRMQVQKDMPQAKEVYM